MSLFLSKTIELVYLLLVMAVFLAFSRLVRGPGLPDRVVALDLISLLLVGLLATHTVATGEAVFLDAAIVLALVAFLGTVAFAYHLGRSGRP